MFGGSLGSSIYFRPARNLRTIGESPGRICGELLEPSRGSFVFVEAIPSLESVSARSRGTEKFYPPRFKHG